MADPKDKTGAAGPASPPAVPSIPRLTPAVPEPVSATEPTASPAGSPPAPGTLPASPAVPQVAPVARPPAPGRPGARSPTGSMPAVPPVAPVVPPGGRTPTGSLPAVPPVAPVVPPGTRTPTGSLPAVPPVAPVVPPGTRTPTGSVPAVPPLPPRARTGPAVPAVPVAPVPPAAQAPEAASELASLDHRHALLDELDYFQVMGLELTASPAEIKLAFHHESRTYHPDRYFQSPDAELRDKVQAVYKRVTEAYFVLRDDARRKRYLADITGPDRLKKLRFDELAEAEAKAAVKKEVAEQIGTHPKGRQFFQSAVADLEAGRFSAAERNIKLALTYEPANPLYKQKLEEAQTKLNEEFKRSGGKGFRIE